MILAVSKHTYRTIVLYTLNPWKHALPVLRVIGPAQQAGFRVIPGNRMEVVSPRLVSTADLVVIQRDFPRLTKSYLEIQERARHSGVPFVFDLDDLLLELPGTHIDQQSQYYAGAYLPMMQAMLDADVVSASTSRLCEYLRTFNPNVALLPNYLNDQIWRLRQPKSVNAQRSPIIIGYMGSNTHEHDLELISPALLEVLNRYGNRVVMKFWGLKPPEILQQLPNVQWIPLAIYDYAEYASNLSAQDCDIALVPLESQPFNRSKSPLKYLENSALGLPGVYSAVPPYEEIVVHGENGLLAASLQDWEKNLSQLIEDPHLRYEIASRAQQTLQQGWLLSQNTVSLQAFYQTALTGARPSSGLAYPIQAIEQAMINLRMALTPPGSLRERVAWAPLRTAQIINTEGVDGMARRFRESIGRPRTGSTAPVLLQSVSSAGGRRHYSLVLPTPRQDLHFNTNSIEQKVSLNKTSIIILTHDNINYTKLCLNNILAHTAGMDYEVIVVDNASSDGTVGMLKNLAVTRPELKIILNEENQGFARGNNQGAAAATGDILIFLNNDTIVTPGWLPGLIRYLQFPQIGMVGPVTNSSGNESRIDVDYRNLDEMLAFAQNYTQTHSEQAFEIGMLAFLCVGLRRSVFQEIGPLDEQFGLGMFEDDDYAIRIRQKNYQIICAQDVFIHHWGSASFSRLPSKTFYRIFNENCKKFEKKWGDKWIA
jgi:GT2 family glycosyltransferase/glycosyltransferase involved in cell wall biosynthesis